jgi:hypothetical protein
VIKRISHGLWFDMIYMYIQLVVCFLSPSQGSGIENTQLVGYKSYQITNHGRSYIYLIYVNLYTLSVTWFVVDLIYGLYMVSKIPYRVRNVLLPPYGIYWACISHIRSATNPCHECILLTGDCLFKKFNILKLYEK